MPRRINRWVFCIWGLLVSAPSGRIALGSDRSIPTRISQLAQEHQVRFSNPYQLAQELHSLRHTLTALPRLVPGGFRPDSSDYRFDHLYTWFDRWSGLAGATTTYANLEKKAAVRAALADIAQQPVRDIDPQQALAGMRALYPEQPKAMLKDILSWGKALEASPVVSFLGASIQTELEHADKASILPFRIFAEGPPFEDREFPLSADALIDALREWKNIRFPRLRYRKLRLRHDANLRSGLWILEETKRHALTHIESWYQDGEAHPYELSLTLLDDGIAAFENTLRRKRVSKQDLTSLLDTYAGAIDLSGLIYSTHGDDGSMMPMFAATKSYWTYRDLYDWIEVGAMPHEAGYPLKPYDDDITLTGLFSGHDAGHWGRLWRTRDRPIPPGQILHALSQYVEKQPEARHHVMKSTVAYAAWEGDDIVHGLQLLIERRFPETITDDLSSEVAAELLEQLQKIESIWKHFESR